MDNRLEISNKVITVEQIKEVAEYIEKTKNYYVKLIKEDKERNNNKYLGQASYKYYAYSMPTAGYKINFSDGRKVETSDIYSFIDSLNEPQYIERVFMDISVIYTDNEMDEKTRHYLNTYVTIDETNIHISTSDENMKEVAYNFYSYIRGIFERGEDRYSKVVKNRTFIKSTIGLAVGSILTLVLFFLGLMLKSQGNLALENLYENGLVLSFLGWLGAFAFGSILIRPIINNLYKEIEKDHSFSYAKLKNTTFKEEYTKKNEILIGKNVNNLEKRETISWLYNLSKKVIFVRLIISIIIVIALSLL